MDRVNPGGQTERTAEMIHHQKVKVSRLEMVLQGEVINHPEVIPQKGILKVPQKVAPQKGVLKVPQRVALQKEVLKVPQKVAPQREVLKVPQRVALQKAILKVPQRVSQKAHQRVAHLVIIDSVEVKGVVRVLLKVLKVVHFAGDNIWGILKNPFYVESGFFLNIYVQNKFF